MGTIKATLHRI